MKKEGSLWYCSATDHNVDDLVVGLFPTLFTEPAHILEGVLNALGHDAVAAVELVSPDVHIVPQQASFHRRCNLRSTGSLCTIADDTRHDSQRIDDRVNNSLVITAAEVSDTSTCTRTQ